jgi:hypothetical protein
MLSSVRPTGSMSKGTHYQIWGDYPKWSATRPHERSIFRCGAHPNPTRLKHCLGLRKGRRVPAPTDAYLQITGHGDHPEPAQLRPRAWLLTDASDCPPVLDDGEVVALLVHGRGARGRAQCEGYARSVTHESTRFRVSKLTRSVLRHIRVVSKQELKDRIMAAMDEFNRHPVVHTWSHKLDRAA